MIATGSRLILLLMATIFGSASFAVGVIELPQGIVGSEYQIQLPASGGVKPYRWKKSDGPPTDLSLTRDGHLQGRLQSAGTYEFKVRLIDAEGQSVNQMLSLNVMELLPELRPLKLMIEKIPDGMVGYDYHMVLAVDGGVPPYTFRMSSIPSGMKFDSAHGELSGKPQLADTYQLAVTVSDNRGSPESVSGEVLFSTHEVAPIGEDSLSDKMQDLPKYFVLAILLAIYYLIKQLFLDKRQSTARDNFLAAGGEIHHAGDGVTISGSEDIRQQFVTANDRYWSHLKLLRVVATLAAVGFVIYLLM